MKKYFTDGLLQLAIVLSLLRTDLNNYLNNLQNYPEVQEILLGPSSAYVQSQNFHNSRWSNELGYSHPKQIENYRSSILRELHSLSDFRRFEGLDTGVDAWLVSHGPGGLLLPDNPVPEPVPPTTQGTGTPNPENPHEGPEDPEGAVGPPPSPDLTSTFRPTDELTKEDMDLIDILWRQDMDLGVGREVFDPNLRRDLEKEQEMNRLKEQEKLESLKQQEEAEQAQHGSQPATQEVSFIVDGETGELVAVAAPEHPAQLSVDTELSMEDAMKYLEEQQVTETQETGTTQQLMTEQLMPEQLMPQQLMTEQLANEDVGREIEAFIENAQRMLEEGATQQPMFRSQASFEAALDEVVGLLDMPSITDPSIDQGMIDTNASMIDNSMIDNNANIIDSSTMIENATEGPLISNTTMTAYNPEFNLLQQTQQAPQIDGTMLPLTNSSLGLPSHDASLFNFTEDLNIFTNITNLAGNGEMNDTDFQHTQSLLRQLMEDDPLEDMMDTTPPQTVPTATQRESISSDSAVSSMGSCSPLGDVDAFSLSEALEGATGGGEYEHKYEGKYSPYPDSNSYSDLDGSSGDSMNFSGSSNGTDPSRSYTNLGDARRYVKHNHSYPLQPGQQPKESKSKFDKEQNRLTTTRDEKRAKEMKIPFSMEEIIHSPVERFNEMLQKYRLNDGQLQLIRDIRRRGKNKVAAQNCRKRKIDALSTIEDDIEDLQKQRDKLVSDHGQLHKELKDFKEKMNQLYNEVFSSLRDDNGHPYDPSQYSLQQTADGSIILVPRNTTEEDTPSSTRRRKGRKNQ